jgi:hypothetical protein
MTLTNGSECHVMKLVAATGQIRSSHGGVRSSSYRAVSRRRETLWAWLSLLTLVICWDAAARLDEKVSPPRPRLSREDWDHPCFAAGKAEMSPVFILDQNALMPVSARPTVS